MPRIISLVFLLTLPFSILFSQGTVRGQHIYVLRGEVFVDLEPIYLGHVDEDFPLDISEAGRRALVESALFYAAMIYGWSFFYEIGERARGLEEHLELTPRGTIEWGDPALRVTHTQVKDSRLWVWTDFHLNASQQRRIALWRSGTVRNAQAIGFGPSHIDELPSWIVLKEMALKDAARTALRTMLRGSERNRPREAHGIISLAAFPRFYIDAGRWAASARFRVQITEIIPFAVH